MKHLAERVLVAGLFSLPLMGCDALLDIILPNMVTVSLVNEAEFTVDGTLFYDDQQEIPRLLLTEVGQEMRFTISPGETLIFSRSCDDLQAIVIDDADLLLIGGLGPEANSDVLRDGDDFGCGDTVIFTFSGGLASFDISTSVAAR